VLAILGGSFNPPHLGHINAIKDAAAECRINRVGLMPCKISPLKSEAPAEDGHRIKMLDIFCQQYSHEHLTLYTETLELSLPSPSYTVKTLALLRDKIGKDSPLCFFLGDDSLYTLPKWREWDALLAFCHLVVMPRSTKQSALLPELQPWWSTHAVDDTEELHRKPHGCVYRCHTPMYQVSSTWLREAVYGVSKGPEKWLPEAVKDYILQHQLYR